MASRPTRWMVFALLLSILPLFTFAGQSLPWGSAPVSTEGTFLLMSDPHFDPFADPALVPALIRIPWRIGKASSIPPSPEPSPLTARTPIGP